MSLQVLYTSRANETLDSIYQLILIKFGQRSASTFVLQVEKTIRLITEQPLMFKASKIDENVRIAVITKQTSLFYRVTNNSIQLLYFWDNRQEPLSY